MPFAFPPLPDTFTLSPDGTKHLVHNTRGMPRRFFLDRIFSDPSSLTAPSLALTPPPPPQWHVASYDDTYGDTAETEGADHHAAGGASSGTSFSAGGKGATGNGYGMAHAASFASDHGHALTLDVHSHHASLHRDFEPPLRQMVKSFYIPHKRTPLSAPISPARAPGRSRARRPPGGGTELWLTSGCLAALLSLL